MRDEESTAHRRDKRPTRAQLGGSATAKQVRGTKAEISLRELVAALKAVVGGDFSVRLPRKGGSSLMQEISEQFNQLVQLNDEIGKEITRVEQAVRREGRMTETASLPRAAGSWLCIPQSVNALISGLVQPSTEVARVISAVAESDLTQKMALEIEGQPLKGEFLRIGMTVNAMVDQ
jgi:hypothetical protein